MSPSGRPVSKRGARPANSSQRPSQGTKAPFEPLPPIAHLPADRDHALLRIPEVLVFQTPDEADDGQPTIPVPQGGGPTIPQPVFYGDTLSSDDREEAPVRLRQALDRGERLPVGAFAQVDEGFGHDMVGAQRHGSLERGNGGEVLKRRRFQQGDAVAAFNGLADDAVLDFVGEGVEVGHGLDPWRGSN